MVCNCVEGVKKTEEKLVCIVQGPAIISAAAAVWPKSVKGS